MSYTVNGKIYTDNPLVDEMVHNAKLIMQDIVVKNSELADSYETEESISRSDIYIAIETGNIKFIMFKYDEDILRQIPEFSEEEVLEYALYNNEIPEEYHDRLLRIAIDEFEYEELNDYYRALNGLPNYGMPGYYLTQDMIPNDITDMIDVSVPLHEFTEYQIGLLQHYGILQRIQEDNPEERYLTHLGSKKVDIFTARTVRKFDIIYIPDTVEEMVANRFREIYEKNRIIYMKRHYSQAYKFNSDYYDEFFIIMLIAQTVTDLIVEIPEWYIRRDIFDVRTVQYILEASGVTYFEEIPLKYQISLVRYLNKIIKYKSSNKNIEDLAAIFDYDTANIFKYYLLKDRARDSSGKYIESDDLKEKYELSFVKVPIGGTLIDSINDNTNISSYNSITTEDKYWDGVDDHDTVMESILAKNFTSEVTKYMSLEVEYDLNEYQFQSNYFLNLLFNNKIDKSNLLVSVPIINTSSSFELEDIFILLDIISFNYYDDPTDDFIIAENRDSVKPVLPLPKQPIGDYEILYSNPSVPEYTEDSNIDGAGAYVSGEYIDYDGAYAATIDEYEDANGGLLSIFNFEIEAGDSTYIIEVQDANGGNSRSHYEVLNCDGSDENPYEYRLYEKINPHKDIDACEMFKDNFEEKKYVLDMRNRIIGFNLEADLGYLEQVIGQRHTSFGFRKGFTLEDLYVDNFIVPEDGTIKSAEELMTIYNTNKECHDKLYELLVESNNYDEYEVYSFAYNYLFTMEMDNSYFKKQDGTMATTYLEFLKDKNILLYNFYMELMEEENPNTRRSNISTYVDKVIDSINLYLNTQMKYMYYSIAPRSWNVVMGYLKLLIDFFKSYKVKFLDINASLVFDNEFDSKFHINDSVTAIDAQLEHADSISTRDVIADIQYQLEPVDEFVMEDKIYVKVDYVEKYFDINGSLSKDRLSYTDLDGQKKDMYGGTSYQDIMYPTDTEDEDALDGGNSSSNVIYDSFYDLDGNTSLDLEPLPEDIPFEALEEWEGGDATYHPIHEFGNIDNGTAIERIYLDYCPDGKDFVFDDEINYNPEYFGNDADGYMANDLLYYYQADAKYAAVQPSTERMYDLDGGTEFYDPSTEGLMKELTAANYNNEVATTALIEDTDKLLYYKVITASYNSAYYYYEYNSYTKTYSSINNINASNYATYLATGNLYYRPTDAYDNIDNRITAVKEEVDDDVWVTFDNI